VIARVALALALLLTAAPALAQAPGAVPDALAAAAEALAAGDHRRARALAETARAQATGADLAEAHRLLGLAWFFLGDLARAEAELLAYLRLDLDGRLDPALVPPEAVTFFEDVRARHGAELRARRPRPRRYALLNLVPPGGQIQNREPTKAWVIGGLEAALAATHVTSYVLLRSWCRREDFTCRTGDVDVPTRARRMRTVNYLAGAALIGVYAYGVVDGFRGDRRRGGRPRAAVLDGVPVDGGGVIRLQMSF
jgi:hypothetical protein